MKGSSASDGQARRLHVLAEARRHFYALRSPRGPRHAERDVEAAFMESGEPVAVLHAGQPLEARSWGHGPTVLLVHGLYVAGGKFRHIAPALANAGLRAVAFDLPGHGRSAAEFVDDEDITEAILDTARAVGPLAGVVCHSMGVVWTLMAMHAGVDVPRAVCIGAPLILQDPIEAYLCRHDVEPEVEKEFRRLNEAFATGAPTPRELAARTDTKALIIHDRDDPLASFQGGQALAEAWTASSHTWTSRRGHFKTLADPSVISDIVAFLAHDRLPTAIR